MRRTFNVRRPSFTAAESSTTVSYATTSVLFASAPTFEYAHAIATADGKFFIGTIHGFGNIFATNQIIVFDTPGDLSRMARIPLPHNGEIATMTYDSVNDRVYFLITGNKDLELYSLNPLSYEIHRLISTSAIDAGDRPAIVTDGNYVYGITNTASSTVFKIALDTGTISFNSYGHISTGHSAAIGIYGTTTELYFGGGMSNGFEKVDAATLRTLGSIDTGACLPTNDMPFEQIDDTGGYVYLGCELQPIGYRVKTSDMSVTKFPLPGNSLGLFIYNDTLINAAEDGRIDVFPDLNLNTLQRFKIINLPASINTNHQAIEPNEIFYSEDTSSYYFTAWWGIPGLFEIPGFPAM